MAFLCGLKFSCQLRNLIRDRFRLFKPLVQRVRRIAVFSLQRSFPVPFPLTDLLSQALHQSLVSLVGLTKVPCP